VPEVVVHWRPVVKAFAAIDVDLKKRLGDDLKEAAAPVVETARQLVERYPGAKVNTITSRRLGPRVWVQQGAKKVTGRRPDFGALQMTKVLMPAATQREEEVRRGVNSALNRYAIEAGF